MKQFVILLALFFFVQLALGRYGHHHHHSVSHENKKCHFQTDKGSFDLRLLMRDMNGKDWELRDAESKSTFFFNPCGAVHNDACPSGAALCQITDKNIAISFGSAEDLTWAEIPEQGVELSYANGEKCDNGIPRKTVVQMTCGKPTAEKDSHQTVITGISLNECLVTLTVKSPYGCPVEQFCTVFDAAECKASESLCNWSEKDDKETCKPATTACLQFGSHHISVHAIVAIMSCFGVLGLCLASVCLCGCCMKRRQRVLRRRRRVLPTTNNKKQKKSASKKVVEQPVEEEPVNIPPPEFIYQPMQQLPPMGAAYAQLNPYQWMQAQEGGVAIPMVQFVPSYSVQN